MPTQGYLYYRKSLKTMTHFITKLNDFQNFNKKKIKQTASTKIADHVLEYSSFL